MPLDRSVPAAVVLVLLGVLATNPAVGVLHVPDAPAVSYGEGALSAANVTLPDSGYVLDRGGYDSRAYRLEVPPASADVTDVTGHPRVVYKLRVRGLGWTGASTTFLAPGDAGRQTFAFRGTTFAPDRIDRQSYDAEVLLLVRSGQDKRVLARRNVTVEVRS